MKTLTLKEAYALAAKGPMRTYQATAGTHLCADGRAADNEIVAYVKVSFHSIPPTEQNANAAILAHAFNVLPEAADALELAIDALPRPRNEEEIQLRIKLRNTLTKINTVQIP